MAELTIHAQDLTGLAGKVIVLTGGSSGIGLATIHLLLSLGAVVVTGDIQPLPESLLLDANNSSLTTTNGDYNNDNSSDNNNAKDQKLEQQQPPPRLTHVPTDVTSWSALTTLFRTALTLHGRIDHVFAGAGVLANRFDYLGDGEGEHASKSSEPTDLAEPTEPSEPSEPPNALEWAINFKAVVNTAYLGMYHMRRQRHQQQQQNGNVNGHGSAAGGGGGGGKGGSIVLAASVTSYIRFRAADYCMSKHAVLGFMRGLLPRLLEQNASFAAGGDAGDAGNGGTSNSAASAIRLNCIAPSWTATGMVSQERFEAIGHGDDLQSPEAVAQTVALLMADEARQGQVVYSRQGKFWEIEERVQEVLKDDFLGVVPPDLAIKAFYEDAAERKAKEQEEAVQVKQEATKQEEDTTKIEEETAKQLKVEQENI